VRFLHSSDWQLGMTRSFLDGDAQARFSEAREQAIVRMGAVARAHDCAFVVVAGDVFETNRVGDRTVIRALEALHTVGLPVYLLPGNHDPEGAGSVYRSQAFLNRKPANVHVLASPEVVFPTPEVELVGVPWTSKHPTEDLVAAALRALPPPAARYRVVVAHGQVEGMGAYDNAALIDLAEVEARMGRGELHYLALGDRHSTTRVGTTGRVWYSGAPEPTDYDEVDPGNVLVVELSAADAQVAPVRVGTWTFLEHHLEVRAGDAEGTLQTWLDGLPNKSRTIVNVHFGGTIGVMDMARVEAVLEAQRQAFGAIDRHPHRDQLAVAQDLAEFSDLKLEGFQREAFQELLEKARGEGPEAEASRDALALLYRLARS
jgi:DNA repair exonuclease SbcCD nuclease subunit